MIYFLRYMLLAWQPAQPNTTPLPGMAPSSMVEDIANIVVVLQCRRYYYTADSLRFFITYTFRLRGCADAIRSDGLFADVFKIIERYWFYEFIGRADD